MSNVKRLFRHAAAQARGEGRLDLDVRGVRSGSRSARHPKRENLGVHEEPGTVRAGVEPERR